MLILPPNRFQCGAWICAIKAYDYMRIGGKIFLLVSLIAVGSYVRCYSNGRCYRYGGYSSARHSSAAHHGSSCFDGNAKLKLFDGNETKISDIKIGDKIWGWNEKGKYETLTIEELKIHEGEFQLYNLKIMRDKKEIYIRDFITGYHPIRMPNNKWCSIFDRPTDKYYSSYIINICKINDIVLFDNKEYKITMIEDGKIVNKVYDIETIGDYNSFEIESIMVFDRRK